MELQSLERELCGLQVASSCVVECGGKKFLVKGLLPDTLLKVNQYIFTCSACQLIAVPEVGIVAGPLRINPVSVYAGALTSLGGQKIEQGDQDCQRGGAV